MAEFTETLTSVFKGNSTMLWTIGLIVVIGGLAVLLLLAGLGFWYFRKRWNLRVEIKLIRGGGILAEWGKGFYDSNKGVVHIRREGVWFGSKPMRIFDLKEYMQGSDIITVEQIGPDDYRPVKPDSFSSYISEYEDGKGGVKEIKESIMNIRIDTGLNKAWKSAWDNAAKQAYSLRSFFSQFQTPIAIGIVIVSVFVGFAIIWSRLGSMC